MTRATLFDLFAPEVVPKSMAEVERCRMLWQDAYYDHIRKDQKYKALSAACLKMRRQGYELALRDAKKSFKANFLPEGQP